MTCAGPLSESLTGGSVGLTYTDFAWALGLRMILLSSDSDSSPFIRETLLDIVGGVQIQGLARLWYKFCLSHLLCRQGKYLANLSKSPFSPV